MSVSIRKVRKNFWLVSKYWESWADQSPQRPDDSGADDGRSGYIYRDTQHLPLSLKKINKIHGFVCVFIQSKGFYRGLNSNTAPRGYAIHLLPARLPRHDRHRHVSGRESTYHVDVVILAACPKLRNLCDLTSCYQRPPCTVPPSAFMPEETKARSQPDAGAWWWHIWTEIWRPFFTGELLWLVWHIHLSVLGGGGVRFCGSELWSSRINAVFISFKCLQTSGDDGFLHNLQKEEKQSSRNLFSVCFLKLSIFSKVNMNRCECAGCSCKA